MQGKGTVNMVILLGRLGADPQLKYTPSGRANVNLSLATNLKWKDQEGDFQEKTDWHRVTAWGKLAEIMGKYLKKGSLVYVQGRLQSRSYEADGVKKWITEVVATEMEMLGKKGEEREEASTESERQEEPESKKDETEDLPF